MKTRLLPLAILLFAMAFNANIGQSKAASCGGESIGSATISIPNLSSTGEFILWTRVQAEVSDRARYKIEINNDECFDINMNGITPNEWVWTSSEGQEPNTKIMYRFDKEKGNTARLIGVDSGVKIDRLLVLRPGCEPVGTGDNCRSLSVTSAAVQDNDTPVQSEELVLSGSVVLAPLHSIDPNNVAKVQYYSDGVKVQESDKYEPFDTSILTNGRHTITSRVTYNDGKTEDAITIARINNPQTALSPLGRWLKINKQPLKMVSFSFAVFSLALLAYWYAKSIQDRQQSLKFRGF